jgi:hypothetical protein
MDPRNLLVAVLAGVGLLSPAPAPADPIAVRYREGVVHGFLVLRSPEGAILASGDLTQLAQGDRVTTRLVFHFKDGSLQDETAIFTQRGQFRLISDHLVQKGRAFERPLDLRIDGASGQVTVRYLDEDGQEKVENERLELPPDLANGLIITLLKNVRGAALPATFSFVAATPKPRLVKLKVTAAGADPFSVAGSGRRATHYVIKVDIGGIAGLVAPLVGKEPPDSHVWILEGEAPAFVRSEAPLFMGGPLVRTDLTSPVWPDQRRSPAKDPQPKRETK